MHTAKDTVCSDWIQSLGGLGGCLLRLSKRDNDFKFRGAVDSRRTLIFFLTFMTVFLTACTGCNCFCRFTTKNEGPEQKRFGIFCNSGVFGFVAAWIPARRRLLLLLPVSVLGLEASSQSLPLPVGAAPAALACRRWLL